MSSSAENRENKRSTASSLPRLRGRDGEGDSEGMAAQKIKLAGWIAVLAALAIAVAIVLLTTDVGAGVIARVRCAPVWLTADATSYRACADVERQQILEQRRRHTPED